MQWKSASSRVEVGTPGFLSISDFNRRVSVQLEQESQASSCVEERNSSCLSSCSQGDRTLVALYLEPAGFSGRCNWGVSAPSCCDFIHRVTFEEVSGHRVLIKSGQGNWCLSEFGMTLTLPFEFLSETGLLLRCDGKVGIPFQTKQGNRPSC